MGLHDGVGDGREGGIYIRAQGKCGEKFSPEHRISGQQEQTGGRHRATTHVLTRKRPNQTARTVPTLGALEGQGAGALVPS